MQIFAQEPSKW